MSGLSQTANVVRVGVPRVTLPNPRYAAQSMTASIKV